MSPEPVLSPVPGGRADRAVNACTALEGFIPIGRTEVRALDRIFWRAPMKKVTYWDISLDTDCPECGTVIDLAGGDLLVGTVISGYEVSCPECSHEFLVDIRF